MPLPRSVPVLIDGDTAPGVVIHEVAHWAAADILGAEVDQVALFRPGGATAGEVIYHPPTAYWRRLGFAFAPIAVNTVFGTALLTGHLQPSVGWTVARWYLASVLLFRALPSHLDLDTLTPASPTGYLHPGVLVTAPIVIGLSYLTRLPYFLANLAYTLAVIGLLMVPGLSG